MRTILSATQWARLRAYVNGLDDEAKKKLAHRCEAWEKSVAVELSRVADGQASGPKQPLDSSLVSQVAGWLRK